MHWYFLTWFLKALNLPDVDWPESCCDRNIFPSHPSKTQVRKNHKKCPADSSTWLWHFMISRRSTPCASECQKVVFLLWSQHEPPLSDSGFKKYWMCCLWRFCPHWPIWSKGRVPPKMKVHLRVCVWIFKCTGIFLHDFSRHSTCQT